METPPQPRSGEGKARCAQVEPLAPSSPAFAGKLAAFDSAMDYEHWGSSRAHCKVHAVSRQKSAPAAEPAAAAAPSPATAGPSPSLGTLHLAKHLCWSDPELEAAFRAVQAEQGRLEQAHWAALRVLVWAVSAVRLAATGSGTVAAALAAACVLPACGQVAATVWRWHAYHSHAALTSSLVQLASDAVGCALMLHAYGSPSPLVPGAPPLWLLRQSLQFAMHAAAYLTLSTLRGGGTFLLRLACASAMLLAELCAARSLWGGLPRAMRPIDAATQLGCQLAGVALLAAAFCWPLCVAYRREVSQRAAFAAARGKPTAAACVDCAWDALGFVVPALAQVVTLWAYLG